MHVQRSMHYLVHEHLPPGGVQGSRALEFSDGLILCRLLELLGRARTGVPGVEKAPRVSFDMKPQSMPRATNRIDNCTVTCTHVDRRAQAAQREKGVGDPTRDPSKFAAHRCISCFPLLHQCCDSSCSLCQQNTCGTRSEFETRTRQ